MKDKTLQVNGATLVIDRKKAGLTVDQLIERISQENQRAPSISTIARAENGGRIERFFLAAIASALAKPIDRYILSGAITPLTTCDIAGRWQGYHIEPDITGNNAITSMYISCEQNGAHLSLEIRSEHGDGDTLHDIVLESFIVADLVMIKGYIEGWKHPTGIYNMMLKLKQGDDVLDGHIIWYDLDTSDICSSKLTLVREDSRYCKQYLAKALSQIKHSAEGSSEPNPT